MYNANYNFSNGTSEIWPDNRVVFDRRGLVRVELRSYCPLICLRFKILQYRYEICYFEKEKIGDKQSLTNLNYHIMLYRLSGIQNHNVIGDRY
jgi:hypothetical protein